MGIYSTRDLRIAARLIDRQSVCRLRFSALPRESAVRCHESRQHRGDELGGLKLLTDFLREDLGVSNEIAMPGGRQLDREPDRLVVRNGGELQLGHDVNLNFDKARARGRD